MNRSEDMEKAKNAADEAFLLGLSIPFRDDIEQRVDLMVRRLGAPTTAEALDQLVVVAEEELRSARRRKDKTGVVVAHAIAASLRLRASRVRSRT